LLFYEFHRHYTLIMINSQANPVKKSASVDCPVDFVSIDENRARVVAFFVVVLVLFYLVNGNPITIALLLADFLLRALNQNQYSPLGLLSGVVVKQLGVKPKPVDRAPKRFAAFVGIVFLSAILAASFTEFVIATKIIAGVLIVFAGLESFLGFCAGCYVYAFLGRFKSQS
jgi:hypothetical protein